MNCTNTKRSFLLICISILLLITLVFSSSEVSAQEEIGREMDAPYDSDQYEDTAHTVLDSDDVIIMEMDEFTESAIIVDGARYSFCNNFKVYNTADILMPLNDLEAALEVKLFIDDWCVRKITVLRFAH